MPTSAPISLPPALHVVAGVIRDGHSRVLLTQRPTDVDHGGHWEFPGGKVEPGETAEDALLRELREELGIDVRALTPLINVPYRYQSADRPLKRIRLETFEVLSYQGIPVGREGQALIWVDPASPGKVSMPEADLPVLAALNLPDRYLITPPDITDPTQLVAGVERALIGGARMLQLRAPQMKCEAMADLASEVALRCNEYAATLLLNSRGVEAIDTARTLGCGLHLVSAGLQAVDKARLAGIRPLAASCHDEHEIALASELGCDFIVLGPVMQTATHPDATPIGWSRFAELRERTALPVFALGGLSPADHAIARAHGAQGIAAIRGLWPCD